MTDLIERSASAVAQMVEQWQAEWLPLHTAHWGDKIEWETARTIARKIDEARLEATTHRFTREDVERVAISMFDHRQKQRGTPNITFDQCVMLRDDWLEMATVALSTIGEVDHG